jgi:hypothetical protein
MRCLCKTLNVLEGMLVPSGIVSQESNRCRRRHKPVIAIESKRRVKFHCPVLCCQFGGRSRSVCSANHLSSVSIYADYLSGKHRRNER